MKKLFALYLFVLLDFFLININTINNANVKVESKIYPLTTYVVELDKANDIVICKDFNGNLYAFQGIEDWLIGDICSMIMSDNGTETITDDKILFVKYDGYID